MVKFKIVARDKKARAGILKTDHGDVLTPCFIPVGTQASVKALSPEDLKAIGAQIILANTYHLMLRPGSGLIKKLGGLHQFMNWDAPLMTDSGGFQIFSLGVAQESFEKLNKFSQAGLAEFASQIKISQKIKPAQIDEGGVTFYSHLDGTKLRLDSKTSIKIQEDLGADLIVSFDDHESPLWDYEETKKSLERTNKWALLSLQAQKSKQLTYGVVHGGRFKDLRVESAKFTDKYFQALAIGGAYSSKKMLYHVIEWVVPYFSERKPRHLLGIGEIEDLFQAIERGVDLFDCVAPTRRARNGSLYISPQNGGKTGNKFVLSISNSSFAQDKKSIDPRCLCSTCQNFSRAYLRHLYLSRELLYFRLATIHNLYFVINLVNKIREAILNKQFAKLKKIWLE